MIRTNGKKRTQWKQWMAGITATMTMVCTGTVSGWTTTNLSRLMAKDSTIVITLDQSSWIVSLTAVGSMIGPFIGAACADTFDTTYEFFKGISDHQEAKKELEVLILSIEKRDTSQNWRNKFRDMLLPNNRKALGIILFLMITQPMSGHYVTKTYLQVLFQKANIGIDTNLATIMVMITNLFSCILSTITIEKLGRRPSMLASTFGTCVILAVLASYLIVGANGIDMTSVNWLPVVIVVLFQISFQLGIGPIPEVLIGELFSSNVKSIGSAALTIFSGVCTLTVSKFYQVIGDAIGEHVVYYIYAGFCLLAFLFSVAFVPETMNKEFDEIQQDLASNRLRCFKKKVNA